MQALNKYDLKFAIRRLPNRLKTLMETPKWAGKVYIGGGYIRSIVAGEPINDIDIFTTDRATALQLCTDLADKYKVVATDNAYTIKDDYITIQIIHRWCFADAKDIIASFDFTIACAVLYYDSKAWQGTCHNDYYADVAAKRLVYCNPLRNEAPGGSMLRVLKYYQRGYRIPLDSLGAVMARMVDRIDYDKIKANDGMTVAKVLTGMLVEVDPAANPDANAYVTLQGVEDAPPDGHGSPVNPPKLKTDGYAQGGANTPPKLEQITINAPLIRDYFKNLTYEDRLALLLDTMEATRGK